MMDRKTIAHIAFFLATIFVFGAGAALGLLLIGPSVLYQGVSISQTTNSIISGTATDGQIVRHIIDIAAIIFGMLVGIMVVRYMGKNN
jgi:hypothetical protein